MENQEVSETSEVCETRDNENEIETKNEQPKLTVKDIPYKKIGDLTDDERQIILESAKNGVHSDYYKVKTFKNGSTRIVKVGHSLDFKTSAKIERRSLTGSLDPEAPVNDKTISPPNSRKYMSNEQFLMEHIIDLEARFAKMTKKQKKLKNKQLEFESSIYYEDEVHSNSVCDNEEVSQDISQEVSQDISQEVSQEIPQKISQPIFKNKSQIGWRAALTSKI